MISLKKILTKILQKLNSIETTIVDYTVTTGSTQYAGWYYANVNLSRANPSAISIVSVTSNRPAFVQLVSSSIARVYCNQANIQVTIRCLYCPAGGLIHTLVHPTISYADGTKGTSASVAAAEVAHCKLTKQEKHVTCVMSICRWDGTTALGRGVTLFTIPDGYRPSADVVRVGICMRYNNGNRLTVSCNTMVYANGTIQQQAAADVTSVYLVAEWDTA